ncbi:MAG: hypothetical protein HYY13_11335 [Nitrospirae bacterium]|nr:hypothetical protein [Nitrospirota bacterium]
MYSSRVAGLLLVALFIGLRPGLASAVPSFSRQTDRSCSSCHVIWPGQLRKAGRVFKFAQYGDAAPEYPGGEVKGDRLSLLRVFPLSARFAAAPYASGPGEPAGSNSQIDRLSVFLSGRVADGVGAHSELSYEGQLVVPAARLALRGPSSANYASGLVVGRMEPGGADPFNTIRHNALLMRWITPALSEGELPLVSTRNFGAVAQVYLFDEIYLAAGPFRGSSAWATADQGLDLFARGAVDHLLDWGDDASVMLGTFVYTGKERDRTMPGASDAGAEIPLTYDTSVRRWGLDAQFQYFSGKHGAQLTAVMVQGRDGKAGGAAPAAYTGFVLDALYVSGWEHGILLRWDSIYTRPDIARGRKTLGFGPVFFLSENVRLGVEWRQQIRTGRAGGEPIPEVPHQHAPVRRVSQAAKAPTGDVSLAPESAGGSRGKTGLSFVIDVAF